MKFVLVSASVFLLIFTTACSQPEKRKETRPNIIVILADDMGYSDIGCFGGEISTPNLDRLAGEGLRITQFYNSGRCCPSRSALLTGLYPHQAGVGGMLQNDGLTAYDTHLSSNSVTLAEMLKDAGYHTMISGKWHVGSEPEHLPTARGFSDQYFSDNTTGHYFGIAKGRKYIVDGEEVKPEGEWLKSGTMEYQLFKNEDGSQWYATDAIASKAIGFVKDLRAREADQPFFLYLPFTAPHWPLHAFEEDIKKYQGKYLGGWDSLRIQRFERMRKLGILDSKSKLTDRNENVKPWNELSDSSKHYYDRLMAVYAAMIDRMDQNIGRVLESLKATGDLDNTMIIFLSDNGGCHEMIHRSDRSVAVPGTLESYDGYEYGWAGASNTPFKWFKHWSHEGGIAAPFIAWYPSMIKPGRVSTSVRYIADLMPTFVDVAASKYPTEYHGYQITPTIGQSLLPLFKGEKDQGRDFTWWEHEGNRAVRKGDWKVVSRYDYATNTELPWELYNLEDDRTETIDLSKKHPEKVSELNGLYLQWAKKVNAVPYKDLRDRRRKLQQKNKKTSSGD
jgi:arylsulfatase A-like enzyme